MASGAIGRCANDGGSKSSDPSRFTLSVASDEARERKKRAHGNAVVTYAHNSRLLSASRVGE